MEAAVALLDARGVEGFSMRALAARLGVAPMSPYEYVDGREDVLDLALDAAIGEIEVAGPGLPWREVVLHQLRSMRTVMRRHPWMPTLMATRPLIGPHALERSQRFYAAVEEAGLRGPALLAAVGTLSSYTTGFVAAEHTWWSTVRTSANDRAVRAKVEDHLREHAPGLARMAHVENDDFDVQFELGARFILDGIAASAAAARESS